jgi:hypothetical protein
MRRNPLISIGIIAFFPLLAAACTVAGDTQSGDSHECTGGMSRPCVGAENCNGTQTCSTDDKWDGCRCDSPGSTGSDGGAESGTKTSCSPTIHCGNGDAYEICTTTLGTQCLDITYAFTMGDSHACSSCTDCSEAAATAAAQCGNGMTHTAPPPDGGSGKDSGHDSGPFVVEGGPDAGGDGDTADLVCGEQADQSDCASCCETNHAAGNDYLYAALVSCACASGGPCTTQCASEACAGVGPAGGDACATCLDDALSTGGACEGPALASCDTNADCLADVVCQDNECASLPSP